MPKAPARPKPSIEWWTEPHSNGKGVIFHLQYSDGKAAHGLTHATHSSYLNKPPQASLPIIFAGLAKRLVRRVPQAERALKSFFPISEKALAITNFPAFRAFARREHFNLDPSPYPESFRTFKHDRTQHMLEGWEAFASLSEQHIPEPITQLLEDLNAAREDIDHLRNSYEGDGLGAVILTIDNAAAMIKFLGGGLMFPADLQDFLNRTPEEAAA